VIDMKKSSFWKGASLALALLIVAGAGKMARAANQATEAKSGAVQNVNAQVPIYKCSIKVPEPEPADLSSLAKIRADQAMAAAQSAFPGTAVKKVELDNENGCLVYSVFLSNGLDVKVDAGNGSVLHKELAGKEGHEGREGREEED
jgi:uncharacterized membrane protein YkoI